MHSNAGVEWLIERACVNLASWLLDTGLSNEQLSALTAYEEILSAICRKDHLIWLVMAWWRETKSPYWLTAPCRPHSVPQFLVVQRVFDQNAAGNLPARAVDARPDGPCLLFTGTTMSWNRPQTPQMDSPSLSLSLVPALIVTEISTGSWNPQATAAACSSVFYALKTWVRLYSAQCLFRFQTLHLFIHIQGFSLSLCPRSSANWLVDRSGSRECKATTFRWSYEKVDCGTPLIVSVNATYHHSIQRRDPKKAFIEGSSSVEHLIWL